VGHLHLPVTTDHLGDLNMTISPVPSTVLQELSERSRACIERLGMHELEGAAPDLQQFQLAAVLVLLYERAGDLRVLLTTRSKLLRSHPGQTALPGGKADKCDVDLIATAYREAHEEVALPLDSPHLFSICQLEPFLANRLLVTPVVALLSDLSVLENLQASAGEVAQIFDHPLEAILDPTLAQNETLVTMGSEHWPYEVEFHSASDNIIPSLGDMAYRMHRFRSLASPIKGLTSDILIKTAEIAYGKTTSYERYAPSQATSYAAVCRLLEDAGETGKLVVAH